MISQHVRRLQKKYAHNPVTNAVLQDCLQLLHTYHSFIKAQVEGTATPEKPASSAN